MIEQQTIGNATLYRGDCMTIMQEMSTTFDCVLTDPPYACTKLDFDKQPINLPALWPELYRLTKPTAWIAMFTQQPFTSDVIISNRQHFRYEMVWAKTMGTQFLNANIRPLAAHENILMFCREYRGGGNKKLATYNVQWEHGKDPYFKSRVNDIRGNRAAHYNSSTDPQLPSESVDGRRHPKSWIVESNGNNESPHPCCKPTRLLERLVRSYSNVGETIFDPFAGSGSTGVAALNCDRRFVGIELDTKYFDVACQRLEQAQQQLRLFEEVAA